MAAALLAIVLLAAPAARAAPRDEAAALRARLAAECDALCHEAVKTPYGWGWNGGVRRTSGAGRAGRGPRVAAIDLRATAAAGLVLHLAGARLAEPRYSQAASQAARLIAAVQAKTGQMPATGIIRANAGGRDEPLAVPSRAATSAGLGLRLTIVHDSAGPDGNADATTGGARFRPAALRAAHWLASQQTRGAFPGGWVVAYPRDAAPGEAMRLVRLDADEYRDAMIALWLAGSVLEEPRLLGKVRLAVEHLVGLRIADDRSAGHNLWQSAYAADGEVMTKVPELPPAIDTLASRNAMQALLAACLMGDAEAAAPVLREAATALEKLPKENGAWRRRYDLDVRRAGAEPQPAPDATPPPAGEEAPPVSDLFKPAPDDGTPAAGESGAVSGVDEVVQAVSRLGKFGPDRYRQTLDAQLPVAHRLALVLCGLSTTR